MTNENSNKAHNALVHGPRWTSDGPSWLFSELARLSEPEPVPPLAPAPDPASDGPEPVPAIDETETPDYFCLVSDEDLDYLLGPRGWPEPCPWCGGRLHHTQACEEQRESWLPTMPFGKHKGQRIDLVPVDYCRWLVSKGIRPRETEIVRAIEARAGMSYPDEATRLSKRPVDRGKVRAWFAKWARYHRGGPLPDGVKRHDKDERRPAVAEPSGCHKRHTQAERGGGR